MTMDIRKIAVVGGFAVGAALTLAPLASADNGITSTLDTEIASFNSLFTDEADLAGVKAADITGGATPGTYESIVPADVATDAPKVAPFSTLDYELYGVSPGVAGVSGDSGSFDLFNGATGEFDNAYNVGLYAFENGGALAPSADLLGTGDLTAALATNTVAGALDSFYNAGIGDLSGFFDTNLSFLDIPAI
jgi:hypothetical protein